MQVGEEWCKSSSNTGWRVTRSEIEIYDTSIYAPGWPIQAAILALMTGDMDRFVAMILNY